MGALRALNFGGAKLWQFPHLFMDSTWLADCNLCDVNSVNCCLSDQGHKMV